MFKRILSLILCSLLAFGMFGCGGASTNETEASTEPQFTQPAEEAKVLYDAVKSPDGDTDYVTCEVKPEDLEGAESALTVYVYCTGNAINIKGIGFTPAQ